MVVEGICQYISCSASTLDDNDGYFQAYGESYIMQAVNPTFQHYQDSWYAQPFVVSQVPSQSRSTIMHKRHRKDPQMQ